MEEVIDVSSFQLLSCLLVWTSPSLETSALSSAWVWFLQRHTLSSFSPGTWSSSKFSLASCVLSTHGSETTCTFSSISSSLVNESFYLPNSFSRKLIFHYRYMARALRKNNLVGKYGKDLSVQVSLQLLNPWVLRFMARSSSKGCKMIILCVCVCVYKRAINVSNECFQTFSLQILH